MKFLRGHRRQGLFSCCCCCCFFFFFFNIYLFIWLHWVLVAARGIF